MSFEKTLSLILLITIQSVAVKAATAAAAIVKSYIAMSISGNFVLIEDEILCRGRGIPIWCRCPVGTRFCAVMRCLLLHPTINSSFMNVITPVFRHSEIAVGLSVTVLR
jgi:hypothetical protein